MSFLIFLYFIDASSAYVINGASPNGNTLIEEFCDIVTDTQGLIARDDNKKEIAVALRGSTSPTDILVDAEIALIPFVSPGVNPQAHTGFLTAWNSVVADQSQLAIDPDYALVSTGHSLGGALSSFPGVALKQNFPNSGVRMFTYGQGSSIILPRIFNLTGANFVNSLFDYLAFRSVHTTDGVPTIIPQAPGYQHHGNASTTRQCAASGEDPTCSDSIPSMADFSFYMKYFIIIAAIPFCN
ncbi:Alpha/Beta hydrolase protein [Flammula alnicola]|nr:Alpha/Beta hydrolase protein [Flammula alnicola]